MGSFFITMQIATILGSGITGSGWFFMYRTARYLIKEGSPMHAYCGTVCRQFKNMYNVTNYYIRQCMSGMKKEPRLLSDNEKEIIYIVNDGIARNNASLNKKTGKPKKQLSLPSESNWFLGCQQLNAVFLVSKNVDYKAMHSHMAQKAIKKCVGAWLSFFALNRDFKTNPGKYKGRCNIPKYIKGDMMTAELTNQSFSVRRDADGRRYISFAKVNIGKEKKEGAVFYIGNYIDTDFTIHPHPQGNCI